MGSGFCIQRWLGSGLGCVMDSSFCLVRDVRVGVGDGSVEQIFDRDVECGHVEQVVVWLDAGSGLEFGPGSTMRLRSGLGALRGFSGSRSRLRTMTWNPPSSSSPPGAAFWEPLSLPSSSPAFAAVSASISAWMEGQVGGSAMGVAQLSA